MKLVFYETPVFTRLLPDYLNDESYSKLQRALVDNPELGDVMPGLAGSERSAGETRVEEKVSEVA